MQLPDGAASRALLIGTGDYESLPGVPEIRNNLWALQDALERHTGLPSYNCRTLLDPRNLTEVGREVEDATKAATDLLLIYYGGHGLVASDGFLHLAMRQTSQQLLPWSGIPFKLIHHAIQVSRARAKVLILDCCFSGKATQLLSDDDSNILGQITANGTFTLTSSPANSPSYAVDGNGHTVFTGALLRLLEHGSPRAGAMLTLNDIYLGLLHHAQDHGLPEPQRRGTNTAEVLPLAQNRYSAVRRRYSEDPPLPGLDLAEPPPASTEPPPASTDALLTTGDVVYAQFKTVKFTEGYDEDEVDEFLDKVALALEIPWDEPQSMLPDDIRNRVFTTTRLREGYDMDEVDSFLDRAQFEFERRRALAAERRGRAPGRR